ncbi:ATP-dependent zinc metalloprotease YME1L1-like isoform X1 [Brachionichthys hirsutus]|uniref:ATP-dependent zinc metalloprotease YME1L1-like isoform X1 n=1 Tax=Brachionichthys hirsutus TaxID=412623 RepID=UPI003604CB09
MFSLSTTFQPQLMNLPLSQLVNALHSLRNSATASVQALQRDSTDNGASLKESNVDLRDLGLSEVGASELDELVGRLLPTLGPGEAPTQVPTAWRTSHVSSGSFFLNKHGFLHTKLGGLGSPIFHRSYHSPLKQVFSELQLLPVCVQNRGFKTLKSRTRVKEAAYDGPVDSEPDIFPKGLLQRETGLEAHSLDQTFKRSDFTYEQQVVFKSGFAEGVMMSRELNRKERKKVSLRRTGYFLLLVCLAIYGWSRTNQYFSGKCSSSDVTFNLFPVLATKRAERRCLWDFAVMFRTAPGSDSPLGSNQMKDVTFEHVKGVDEAKNELRDVVEFLKNPQKFTALGGKLPKGILLIGPPGTGKTLLARAMAGEADVPFYPTSGSEFDEMFVGVGASRIRNLFKEAKANAPCVIFIDELDSVGGRRTESSLHPHARQSINQLLAEMDGFKRNEGVIVLGGTNLAESLDPALLRPGRFDVHVTVPRPDVKGRTEILEWYLSKVKVDPAVDAEIIARCTTGFSGADLENLVNQAALKAAVDEREMVTMKELDFARDKILMGPERKSVVIDNKNKTITAYHESGHAIVAYFTKDAMAINKATIMPRGASLGHVSMMPEKDGWHETRSQLLAQMDVSMGGRVAEELIFGADYITSGASSDFDSATKVAKGMVTKFGMSDKLGVMTYSDVTKQSPETQAAIEQEVRLLLKDSYERAKNILKTYNKEHKTLADALLRYETLDAKEIRMVLEGKSLDH